MEKKFIIHTQTDLSAEEIADLLKVHVSGVYVVEEQHAADDEAEAESDETPAEREARIAYTLELFDSVRGMWSDRDPDMLEKMRIQMWEERYADPKPEANQILEKPLSESKTPKRKGPSNRPKVTK